METNVVVNPGQRSLVVGLSRVGLGQGLPALQTTLVSRQGLLVPP